MKTEPKYEPALIFPFKQIWTWDKGMFLSMALDTVFFSMTPMIAIYVPKLVIDSVQRANWQSILIILVGGFCPLCILRLYDGLFAGQ